MPKRKNGTPPELNLELETMDWIREQYKAGRRTVTFKDGSKFKLSLFKGRDKHRVADKDETSNTVVPAAEFIVVKPANGSLTPTAQVERVRFNSSVHVNVK